MANETFTANQATVLTIDNDADVEIDGGEEGPQVDPGWGEPGLTPAERVYGSNVFHVLAFTTGTPGRPVNAVPPKAVANCQLASSPAPISMRSCRRCSATCTTTDSQPSR